MYRATYLNQILARGVAITATDVKQQVKAYYMFLYNLLEIRRQKHLRIMIHHRNG